MTIIQKKSFSRSESIDVALDIGSSKIACVVGKNNNEKKIKILGHSLITTKNVKKGYVVDPKNLEAEIRVIKVRFGTVLSKKGGVLKKRCCCRSNWGSAVFSVAGSNI